MDPFPEISHIFSLLFQGIQRCLKAHVWKNSSIMYLKCDARDHTHNKPFKKFKIIFTTRKSAA